MILFDYFFYRVAKFFFRKDGTFAPRAVSIVTTVQGMLAGELAVAIMRVVLGFDETARMAKDVSKTAGVVFLALLVLNYARYSNKYYKIADRWIGKEDPNHYRTRGILVVAGIVLPFVIMVYMGTEGYRR